MPGWKIRQQTGWGSFVRTGEIEAFLDNPEGETVASIVTCGETTGDDDQDYATDCAVLAKIEAALNAYEQKGEL